MSDEISKKTTAGKITKSKIVIFITSLFIAIIAGAGTYAYLRSGIDPLELAENIDIKNETGLAKLKLYLDSASVAGVAFCVSSILLLIFAKISNKKHSDKV